MKFKFKLDEKDLFRFSLIHSYTGTAGIFALVVGLIGISMIVQGAAFGKGTSTLFTGILMLVLFFILNPFMLYLKAKKQAKTNKMYQTETECMFDEAGMHIYIEDQEGMVHWNQIFKIQHMFGLYMIYTGAKTAFVFNEEKLGSDAQSVMNYIYAHVGARVKLPKGAVRK